MAISKKKIRIGDLLVQNGVITEDQLMTALAEQKNTGQKIGRVLISLGFVDEDRLLQLLSQQLEIPFIDLRHYQLDTQLAQSLPETFARRYRALILGEENGQYIVGMADPMDIFGYDELSRILQQDIQPAVVRESELLSTLDIIYRRTDEIAAFAEKLDEELSDGQFDIATLDVADEEADVPIVKLLQSIFEDAVQIRASDIHIEPDETVLRIRLRVDGVLQEQVMNEKRIASALVLRLKLMSSLNISEKRLPQDGRFNIRVKGHNIDVRLSSMPVQHGESIVMRLLDQTAGAIGLDQSGMPKKMLARFRQLIHMPHGLILVTGPTGSGKTTTLYGGLQELNVPGKKIITVEDPVEYNLPRINQVQVNTGIGLDFGRVLRATLRQDPDILLVGEIRDQETAEIALRAAMTGHMVLSTLHTNDAVSSAMRLVDMGAEGYLAATALKAVIAQRLVRRLCDSCSQPQEPDLQEKQWLRSRVSSKQLARISFRSAKGCHRCNNTGYRGRVGVFELLEINSGMADALRSENTNQFVQAAKRSPDFKPLALNALNYAAQGITSMAEVLRVAEQVEEDSLDTGDSTPADTRSIDKAGVTEKASSENKASGKEKVE